MLAVSVISVGTAGIRNPGYRAARFDRCRIGFVCVIIDIEHTIELCQHKAKNTSRNSECRTENDPNVTHRHLVDVGILYDRDEVGSQSTEKGVICDWQDRDKMRELGDPFLGIYQV